MKQIAAKIHVGLAWLMFIGANIALVLISLPVFGAASPEIHAWGGRIIWFLSLAAVIASLVARSSRRNIWLTILTSLLIFPGQGFFAYTTFPTPILNSLHAVNGLAILYLSYALANGRARATVPQARQATAVPAD